eukprot:scaffold107533_cov63-Phaeocystis_antarctica.AAC.3
MRPPGRGRPRRSWPAVFGPLARRTDLGCGVIPREAAARRAVVLAIGSALRSVMRLVEGVPCVPRDLAIPPPVLPAEIIASDLTAHLSHGAWQRPVISIGIGIVVERRKVFDRHAWGSSPLRNLRHREPALTCWRFGERFPRNLVGREGGVGVRVEGGCASQRKASHADRDGPHVLLPPPAGP